MVSSKPLFNTLHSHEIALMKYMTGIKIKLLLNANSCFKEIMTVFLTYHTFLRSDVTQALRIFPCWAYKTLQLKNKIPIYPGELVCEFISSEFQGIGLPEYSITVTMIIVKTKCFACTVSSLQTQCHENMLSNTDSHITHVSSSKKRNHSTAQSFLL